MKVVLKSIRRDIMDALRKIEKQGKLDHVEYIRLTAGEYQAALSEFGQHGRHSCYEGFFRIAYAPEVSLSAYSRDTLTTLSTRSYQFDVVHEGSPRDTQRGR